MQITEKDYEELKKYCVALEATRADLWGQNEDLRNKIGALERGQEDLIEALTRAAAKFLFACGHIPGKDYQKFKELFDYRFSSEKPWEQLDFPFAPSRSGAW